MPDTHDTATDDVMPDDVAAAATEVARQVLVDHGAQFSGHDTDTVAALIIGAIRQHFAAPAAETASSTHGDQREPAEQ